MTTQEDARLVPLFKTTTVLNDAKTKKEGRPIFDEMEVVEIRFAGDRQKISVFPALAFSMNVAQPDGTTEPVTYAERFPDQYRRFKEQKTQIKEGTPIEELPFLTAAQRSELKALNIYTVETLADLDGQPLKNLGMGGRGLASQAQAYLQHASDTALPTRLAAENEDLKAQLAELRKEASSAKRTATKATKELDALKEDQDGDTAYFESWSDDDLREFVKSETGSGVRGNPSHETLVRMAKEAQK